VVVCENICKRRKKCAQDAKTGDGIKLNTGAKNLSPFLMETDFRSNVFRQLHDARVALSCCFWITTLPPPVRVYIILCIYICVLYNIAGVQRIQCILYTLAPPAPLQYHEDRFYQNFSSRDIFSVLVCYRPAVYR